MILLKPRSPDQRRGAYINQFLLITVIICLLGGTMALTGCVRYPSPVIQPTTTTSQETLVIPSSAAVQPPVPAAYQSLYNSLKTDMDNYDTTRANQNTNTNYPIIFGAELLQADDNRGDVLLQPQVMDSVRLMLDRYKAMGIQGVTIPIAYPLYTPDYPRHSEYEEFYRQVAEEVHNRGMDLCVENHILFANTMFSPVKWDYSGVTFDQYKNAKKSMVETIINDTHPEFLDISAEPDTEFALTHWRLYARPGKSHGTCEIRP